VQFWDVTGECPFFGPDIFLVDRRLDERI